MVETGRYRTELVEKSLEAEAAALTFRRPRDTQPRHISQIGEDHSSALARAWRLWFGRVGRERVREQQTGGELRWGGEARPREGGPVG